MAARKSGDTIEITRAELDSAVVTAAVERAKEAAQVPLRREVGAADLTKGFNTGAQVAKVAALGVAAMIVNWLFGEVALNHESTGLDEYFISGAKWGAAGTFFAVIFFTALQAIEEQSAEKFARMAIIAAPLSLIAGVATGLASYWVYLQIGQGDRPIEFDWIRGASWGLSFIGVGIVVGIAYRSIQKGLNGILGGAIGGLIGGGVFPYVYSAATTSETDTGTVARLVAYIILGAITGAAIGLADAVRKNLWLQIATGGMAGKQFIVYQQNAVLGSSASADITLIKDPEIAGMHVRLSQKSGGTTFEVLEGASDVLLNGEAARRGKLSDGVLLQVGGTVLQFGEKNVEMPTIA